MANVKDIEVIDPIIVGTNNKNESKMAETAEKKEPTIKELEELLAKKKADKRNKHEQEKKQYEEEKDHVVKTLFTLAKNAANYMADIRKTCSVEMKKQAKALEDYGKFPRKSKGGFSIDSADGKFRITRTRDTQPHWDERSEKGANLIKEFLGDSIKKKDKDAYEMLMELLVKNDAGQLEYSRVMVLLHNENRFSDARWHEGLKLLKESYSIHMKGYGYRFKYKDDAGKWQNLDMNFSSL